MAVPALRDTPKSRRVIWSAPRTCPHGSGVFMCRNWSIVWCCVAWVYIKEAQEICHRFYSCRCSMDQTWKDVYIHIYTWTQTVHLEVTDPVAHLGLLECEEPPRAQTNTLPWPGCWLWIPAAAPNPVSQPLLSSMVDRGRTAEQISLFFFLCWWRQRLPTCISTAAPRGSWLSFHYCKLNCFSFFWGGGGAWWGRRWCVLDVLVWRLRSRLLSNESDSNRWSVAFITLTAAYIVESAVK